MTAEQKATGGLFGMLTGKFGPGTGLHKTMVKGFAKADMACVNSLFLTHSPLKG